MKTFKDVEFNHVNGPMAEEIPDLEVVKSRKKELDKILSDFKLGMDVKIPDWDFDDEENIIDGDDDFDFDC